MKKILRSLAISLFAVFIMVGSAYGVTIINADLSTEGTVHIGTGTGDEGVLSYDTGTDTLIINDDGADINFRVETDTNANGIHLDAGAETLDLVGGSGSTGCTIDAGGNLTCTGNINGNQ